MPTPSLTSAAVRTLRYLRRDGIDRQCCDLSRSGATRMKRHHRVHPRRGRAPRGLAAPHAFAQAASQQAPAPRHPLRPRRRARPRPPSSATRASGSSRPAKSFRRSGRRSASTTTTSIAKPASRTSATSSAPSATASADRVELFGSVRVVTRIDRDFRPLYDYTNAAGGPVNEHPLDAATAGRATSSATSSSAASSTSCPSTRRRRPPSPSAAFVKLPDRRRRLGRVDRQGRFRRRRHRQQGTEQEGRALRLRRLHRPRLDPDDVEISNGLRYGFGVGFPTRSPIRITAELFGEKYFDDTDRRRDRSTASTVRSRRTRARWSSRSAHVDRPEGLLRRRRLHLRAEHEEPRATSAPQFDDEGGDYFSGQVRIGYHPGVRIYVPPPPPPPPPPPATPVNRPPTVKARCEPCIVEVGKSSTVTGDANDPDGDPLTYRWTTPTGTLANPADRQTLWTAPMQEGSVPVTVYRRRRQERHGERHGARSRSSSRR